MSKSFKKWFCNKLAKTDAKRIARQSPPDGVETFCDIPYVDDGNLYHLLDVYRPEGADKPLPLIMDIHGGGWYYGVKEINKYYCMELTKRGFAVVSINYRLAIDDGVTFVTQLQDVFAAFEWIKAHGEDYGYDPDKMFITGDSAGGHLASLALATLGSTELQEFFGLNSDIRFRAACFTCGALSMAEMADNCIMKAFYADVYGTKKYRGTALHAASSLKTYLTGDMCPVLLTTAYADFIGKHSREYVPIFKEKGVECEILDWKEPINPKHKLAHVFNIIEPLWEESVITNDRMCDFFKKHLV